ncbi:MAG: phage holin family protein [Finegoldia sp.]|nr:phage holin family protein [Finegoldia sp.]
MRIEITDLKQAYDLMAHSIYFHALFLAIVLDIVTGFSKAIVNKKFNSTIGTKGIIRHVLVILLSVLITPYLLMMGFSFIAKALLGSFIVTYGMSIIENCTELGIPIPKGLYDVLAKAGGKIDTINFEDVKKVCIDKKNEEIDIEVKDKKEGN